MKKRNPLKPEKELHKVSWLTFTVGHQEPQFDFLATPVLKNAWQDCNNPHPPLIKAAIIIVKLKKENMNRMLDVVNSESLEGRVQEPQWSFRPKELSVK